MFTNELKLLPDNLNVQKGEQRFILQFKEVKMLSESVGVQIVQRVSKVPDTLENFSQKE